MSKLRQCLILSFFFVTANHFVLTAQTLPDSTVLHRLDEVEITASHPASFIKSTVPVQSMSATRLERINALQVSDAVKYFSGVQVKDYGGIGGLKTVSIRSLGANYTAVAYDGITVSDYQTGQIDLGRFSLDNVEQIRLSTGSNDDIFQPAKNLSSGGLIQIMPQQFSPTESKREEIKAGLKTGSWKMINPFISYSRALNKIFTWNVSGEYLNSKGDYPFLMDGERRRRNNSEVENWKWEGSLNGKWKNNSRLSIKTYYYDSNRNIPGSVISGNTFAGEGMKDRSGFVQANYKQELSPRWSLMMNAKYSSSSMRYLNLLYFSRDSRYYQQETYLNVTLLYRWSQQLSFSWANDGSIGNFRAIHQDNSLHASRSIWLSAWLGKYENHRLTLNVSGINHWISESATEKTALKNHGHFSLSAGLSVQPAENLPLRLRTSYRNTFRMPTFADMYYPNVPNTNLKPENAHQYNLGGILTTTCGEFLPYISFSADAYYNKVEDKIVSIPLSSLALWSVRNYGKADIKGVDLNVAAHTRISSGLLAEISGNYTRQKALNEEKQLLRYTPRHFATILAALKTPWCHFNYNLIYCGKRYYNEMPLPDYLVKAYTDHGFSITKTVLYKKYRLHFSAECLNWTNLQYEVVHGYPMPGRSFRFGIRFQL